MKLYTEKEVRNSMNSMKIYIGKYNENVIDKIIENHIRALGGIELPSDEEIEKKAEITFNIPEDKIGDVYFCANIAHSRRGFKIGLKKFINKIQGGNK